MHKLRPFPEFCYCDAVHQYYSSLNPANKAVISLLDVYSKTDAKRDCLFFTTVHTWVRKVRIDKLLRFTTRSDKIAVDKITVDLLKLMGYRFN